MIMRAGETQTPQNYKEISGVYNANGKEVVHLACKHRAEETEHTIDGRLSDNVECMPSVPTRELQRMIEKHSRLVRCRCSKYQTNQECSRCQDGIKYIDEAVLRKEYGTEQPKSNFGEVLKKFFSLYEKVAVIL